MPLKDRKELVQCIICSAQVKLGSFAYHLKFKHKSLKRDSAKKYYKQPDPWTSSQFAGFRALLPSDAPDFPGLECKVTISNTL